MDKIYVVNPIRFTNIRRNEVKSKFSAISTKSAVNGGSDAGLFISTSDDIQQRAATVLRNVHYVIEAHFVLTENAVPATTKENPATLCVGGWKRGSATTSPALAVANFPQPSGHGQAARFPPPIPKEDGSWG